MLSNLLSTPASGAAPAPRVFSPSPPLLPGIKNTALSSIPDRPFVNRNLMPLAQQPVLVLERTLVMVFLLLVGILHHAGQVRLAD